jgi:hypothetical protein
VVVDAKPDLAQQLLQIAAKHPGDDTFAVRVDDFVFNSKVKITLTQALLDELRLPGVKVNLLETRNDQSKKRSPDSTVRPV